MDLNWQNIYFNQLSLQQLYELGKLRQTVFIVEQNCPYIDFDGKDLHCYHLMGLDTQNTLQAYARLVPPSVSYTADASIGRVLTSQKIRATGAGKILMQKAILHCRQLWPDKAIRISAQTYLLRFYTSLGFTSTGKEYLEDGIPHTEMLISKM